jgi:hypothetical protein
MNICDGRDRIEIVVEGFLPAAARLKLLDGGFKPKPGGIWEAPANPQNYMAAQAIGATFFSEEKP